MIITPGNRGQSFITQLYFRDMVPVGFENYVRKRESQFGLVSTVKEYELSILFQEYGHNF